MSTKTIVKGYCSDCGEWADNCKTIITYGTPEKICERCRDAR